MANTFFGISLDCADASAVAGFWAQVLGRQVADEPTPENAVVLADGDSSHGPRMSFHQVPEHKTVKNRLHIDLVNPDFEAESARLLGLGASKVQEVAKGSARWTTFRDIEGNEFDLIAG